MKSAERWWAGMVIGGAVLVGYAFFLFGRQELVGDAATYVQLGAHLAAQGFSQFADETRTYGYPLFIALIWQVSQIAPEAFRFVTFNVQLALFLASCLVGWRVFRRLFPEPAQSRLVFALIALNPFLLIYTGVILSDLLSAILIFLALLFAVYPPRAGSAAWSPSAGGTWDAPPSLLMGLAFFFGGCATMVRPANLTLGVAPT